MLFFYFPHGNCIRASSLQLRHQRAGKGRNANVQNAQPCATAAYSRVENSRFEMNLEKEKGGRRGRVSRQSSASFDCETFMLVRHFLAGGKSCSLGSTQDP